MGSVILVIHALVLLQPAVAHRAAAMQPGIDAGGLLAAHKLLVAGNSGNAEAQHGTELVSDHATTFRLSCFYNSF